MQSEGKQGLQTFDKSDGERERRIRKRRSL